MNITCNTKGNQREILSKLTELFPRLRWGSGRALLAYIPVGYINFERGEIYTLDSLTYGGARPVSQEVFFQKIAEYYGISLKKNNPIIADPTSEEAKALIGKRVYVGDSFRQVVSHDYVRQLERIDPTAHHPFEACGGWILIQAIPEEETQEVTMEEVCQKFGKNVKIKKGE